MASLYKLSLLSSGVEPAAFEQFLAGQIFNKDQILRRNVRATTHLLFKCQPTGTGMTEYIWAVFAEMVGPTPELASQGGSELRESILPIQDLSACSLNMQL
jgi:hypothetical protein